MTEQQKFFKTADNTELFYRYRPAKDGLNDKAIVLFHRGHEHSGRMMFVADELGFDDFVYFAWDARGHGNSPGERGKYLRDRTKCGCGIGVHLVT